MRIAGKKSTRYTWFAVLIFAGILGAVLLLARRPDYGKEVQLCLAHDSCADLNVRAGSQSVSSEQISTILSAPELKTGASLVKRCYDIVPRDGKPHLILTADVGQGEQAFNVILFDNAGHRGMYLGSLVLALLTIKELSEDHSIRTEGPLFEAESRDLARLVPAFQNAGIKNIEVAATDTAPVENAPEVFLDKSRNNYERKLRVLRP